MKKFLALFLALVMLLSFTACSGNKGDAPQGEAPKEENTPTMIPIDYEAEGEQPVSEERASKAALVETLDVWLEGKMTFALDSAPKTYADFVEHIGCEASFYENKPDDGERWYIWVAEEDESAKLLAVFWETPQGWTLYSVGSTNLK